MQENFFVILFKNLKESHDIIEMVNDLRFNEWFRKLQLGSYRYCPIMIRAVLDEHIFYHYKTITCKKKIEREKKYM